MKMHEDNYLGILTEWSHTEWSVIKHMRTEVSKYKNFISFWDDNKYDVARDKVWHDCLKNNYDII